MPLVNTIRTRVAEWQAADRPSVSRVTAELLSWWERDGLNFTSPIIRLSGAPDRFLIAEMKGADEFGRWDYTLAMSVR